MRIPKLHSDVLKLFDDLKVETIPFIFSNDQYVFYYWKKRKKVYLTLVSSPERLCMWMEKLTPMALYLPKNIHNILKYPKYLLWCLHKYAAQHPEKLGFMAIKINQGRKYISLALNPVDFNGIELFLRDGVDPCT